MEKAEKSGQEPGFVRISESVLLPLLITVLFIVQMLFM